MSRILIPSIGEHHSAALEKKNTETGKHMGLVSLSDAFLDRVGSEYCCQDGSVSD
jgi:hypothetical protein